ncbi:hypothetical protein FJT64_002274 [Amphibalanus amphitrite]|uniref:Uncharacterized protein n=1 Tax=Amphibalanus amphitrite TaxID=1232801 RepID=A0A6A4WZG5_AMPAM|nr:hypothetical protein FJT64_002274 [Amphibalanus amphitrite]
MTSLLLGAPRPVVTAIPGWVLASPAPRSGDDGRAVQGRAEACRATPCRVEPSRAELCRAGGSRRSVQEGSRPAPPHCTQNPPPPVAVRPPAPQVRQVSDVQSNVHGPVNRGPGVGLRPLLAGIWRAGATSRCFRSERRVAGRSVSVVRVVSSGGGGPAAGGHIPPAAEADLPALATAARDDGRD